jgi:hypothetical protein
MKSSVAQIGKAIIWVYTQHLLTFTVAAFLGAFECFTVLWALGWRPPV